MHDNPSISSLVANGQSTGNTEARNPATRWPLFSPANPYMIDLNQTGGHLKNISLTYPFVVINTTELVGPGLQNSFREVDAYTWEGGRGTRCDFWRSIAAKIPG